MRTGPLAVASSIEKRGYGSARVEEASLEARERVSPGTGTIRYHSLTQSHHVRGMGHRPTLISLRAPCLTYVGREGYAWGRLYTSKLPLTAVQVMNNDVLPFFDEHRVRVKTVLSDNGREFCGRPDRHPYELFLQLEDIEHRTTKVGRPQSNGFIERFHRTLLDEHLRVKGRTTWYETVEEMQQDLEAYLETYNRKRPHRGRAMEGRTPYQVFKAGLTDARKAAKARKEEAKTKAA